MAQVHEPPCCPDQTSGNNLPPPANGRNCSSEVEPGFWGVEPRERPMLDDNGVITLVTSRLTGQLPILESVSGSFQNLLAPKKNFLMRNSVQIEKKFIRFYILLFKFFDDLFYNTFRN
ncbi:hypothetical protein V1477_014972 [Vespula maculifrons]|uniref:Uncharacterized protein n=1 Tax=Vespula maculifrons TaxID=7453 RepID=A0ABD2BIY8_VESMC